MNLQEYLNNPCKTLSIPYWKNKQINIPKDIIILHEDEYLNTNQKFSKVDKFFRVIHKLDDVPKSSNSSVMTIDIKNDIDQLISLINICYEKEKIKINLKDINSWINRITYRDDLWIKIVLNGKIIASGIAEIDYEVKEGILEWIQVDPLFQGQGYGKMIVNELIYRLSKIADFITVSGRINNNSNPLGLYKSCGFEGADIWNICYQS